MVTGRESPRIAHGHGTRITADRSWSRDADVRIGGSFSDTRILQGTLLKLVDGRGRHVILDLPAEAHSTTFVANLPFLRKGAHYPIPVMVGSHRDTVSEWRG